MVNKGRYPKEASGSKKAAKKVQRIQLPLDTYEEWLRRQVVKDVVTKPEVQVPLDSYEGWIREQVKRRS